jgi:hypothetical protein
MICCVRLNARSNLRHAISVNSTVKGLITKKLLRNAKKFLLLDKPSTFAAVFMALLVFKLYTYGKD